jgi:diketogulonate reductase-like aldo/keto reductase
MKRRQFIQFTTALTLSGIAPRMSHAQQMLPQRGIPATGERLPVIGLGSTKPVMQIPQTGTKPLYEVIQMLVDAGGSVIDTAPRPEPIDREFGLVLQDPRWRDLLFVSTKINVPGRTAAVDQFQQTLKLFGGSPDLVQVESMVDVETHWPLLQDWKARGMARYIGVTVANTGDHERLISFMRRSRPDFIQVNYSVAEPQAGTSVLPAAAELGIAAQINRPFMNGEYFQKTRGRELPEWAAEIDCASWAQFSLKFILAHPAVICVLTETTNPEHMRDNLQAAYGRLPDAALQARMRSHIENM